MFFIFFIFISIHFNYKNEFLFLQIIIQMIIYKNLKIHKLRQKIFINQK